MLAIHGHLLGLIEGEEFVHTRTGIGKLGLLQRTRQVGEDQIREKFKKVYEGLLSDLGDIATDIEDSTQAEPVTEEATETEMVSAAESADVETEAPEPATSEVDTAEAEAPQQDEESVAEQEVTIPEAIEADQAEAELAPSEAEQETQEEPVGQT